jgi:hypothetical protein
MVLQQKPGNIPPCTVEPIPQECLSWAAETMYDNMHDNVDQLYEDLIVFYGLPQPRSSWNRHQFYDPLPGQREGHVLSQPPNAFPPTLRGHYFTGKSLHRSAFAFPLPFGSSRIHPSYPLLHSIDPNSLLIRACLSCNLR